MTTLTHQSDLKTEVKSVTTALNRWFYPLTGVLMLAFTLIGFHFFYLGGRAYPGRPLTPPIKALVIAHAVTMSAWILLYTVQPFLIALRRHRLHMALGRVGGMLALVILITGVVLSVRWVQVLPPEMVIWAMSPRQFVAVPLISVFVFAACVGVGVWKRRRQEIHRPAMFLGTLAAISAAVSRIDGISVLYQSTVWERAFGPFFASLILGGVLVLLRVVLARRIEPWLALGYLGMVVLSAGIIWLARTPAWDAFVTAIAG